MTERLMEEVASRQPEPSLQRVKANKGAPGVDGMTVDELRPWIASAQARVSSRCWSGTYQPQPVRGVEIPKPGGGMRQLGIPTVVDRLVQQAILQVLEPIAGPDLLGVELRLPAGTRGAHMRSPRARQYVAEGTTSWWTSTWRSSSTG